MRKRLVFLLSLFLVGAIFGLADKNKKEAPPQVCLDEEAMVTDYEKGLNDLVGTVQKEKLEDFQRAFHRRTCLSKLNLCEAVLDTATACYDNAIKDPATPKASAEEYKAKRDAYAKLKEKLIQYRDSLKTKENAKEAKALIETFHPTE